MPNGRHILKAKANIDGNDYFSDVVVFYVATPRQTYAKSESDFESGLGNYTAGSGECVASPTESGKFSYKISNATSGMLLLYPEKHSTLHQAEQIWDFDMYVDDLADVSDLNMYFYSGAESTAKTNLLQPNADGKIVFKGPNGKEYPLSQEQWYHITVKYNNPQGRVEIFADVLGDGVPVSLGIHTYSSGPQNNTYAVRMQTSGTAYSVYFDNSRCIESHYSAFVKNISYYVGSTRYSEDNVPGNPDKIVLELNENKLPSTITNTAIYLKKGETIITPTITDASEENKYITMTFNPALESSTEYTIYVAQSVDTYKWAHSTTDQTYKFETAFYFDLYGISQYSRVNGDASTKLTAISGKKDDISLYVDGRRYAVCEDTQEAIFELKDLTYGTHTLYAKLENNNVTTPETTFYCYTETKTELAANREFSGDASTSGTELFEFPIWGTKHGTIATPGKTNDNSYVIFKKGTKGGAQIITTETRSGDANLFKEERVLEFDLYVDEVGDNNMDLHLYTDKSYRAASIILPSETGDKSVFKGADGKEYPITEDTWYHISIKFNFSRGTIETFADVYGNGIPVSLGRGTFTANSNSATMYIYADVFGKNNGASEAYIDNVVLSSIAYSDASEFCIESYKVIKGTEVISPEDVKAGHTVSFEIKFKNKTNDIKSGKVYFVAYKADELVYVNVQDMNLNAGATSVTVSSDENYIATEKPDKVRVFVWDNNCVPYFVAE